MIDKALGELHYNINSARNPKQQALEIIKQLQERNIIPIARAQMRIQLILPSKESKRVKEKLMPMISQVEQEDFGNVEYQMECLIDPGQFRPLSDLLQQETKGRGRLDLLSLKETVDHEEKF
jgi:ribosome maturation protein SDO1